ncbi:ABC transporter [Streptomyces boninensis]|uniref:ABC transporter n=1 Tax=Streptomyces boninensis TaxID=2039455 RepID=UPI003B21FD16
MTALLRYQAALLLRSQRWLPPVLLYAVVVGIGVRAGDPVLDSLGFAAAALLPVSAWLVRVCVNTEPSPARAVAAAARGPWRVHLAAVLTGLCAAVVLGVVGTGVTTAIGDGPTGAGGFARAAGSGMVAAVTCALVGTVVGALCNRPLLRRPGWSVPATALSALALLVAGGSPANAAVSDLVTASRQGTLPVPWLPLAGAAAAAAVAVSAACAAAARRG